MNALFGRIAGHAHTRPHAAALWHDGQVARTWSGLWSASLGLAARLSAAGVGPEGVVGLHLPRGPDWVVAALGVWAAGGAILPVSPELPIARRRELATRGQAAWVLGERLGPIPHVALDVGHVGTTVVARAPHDLAWVLFTSGSTGRPKGVRVEDQRYAALLAAQTTALGLGPLDRCAWLLSPQFDASLSDIGVALWSGATLCTSSVSLLSDLPALDRWLADAAISYADLPPRLLSWLTPEALPGLRAVLCGGEPLPPDGARRWSAHRRLVGVYGPTEATICTSLWVVDPAECDRAWIGEPVAGARLRAVDGELWIGGDGLARDYLGESELTAERFVEDSRGRWFRTRDRVTQAADGRLVFAGRLDRQGKVDGRLVCPEEVEAALRDVAGVIDVHVELEDVPHPGQGGSSSALLHAFVETRSPEVRALAEAALRERLPEWLVPRRWTLGVLPRGETGKVALPRAVLAVTDAAPTALDALDTLLLAELGGTAPDHATFAELGLDSLGVVTLAARLATAGFPIGPDDVRASGSIAGLRARLRAGESSALGSDGLIARAEALASTITVVPRPRPAPTPSAVLLTGGTGFLGARVLAGLLAQGASVLALVRASDEAAGRARLRSAFHRYQLDSAGLAPLDLDCLDLDRLTVVPGDLSDLPATATGPLADRLRGAFGGLIHLGASVTLERSCDELWPVHVQATAGLLALTPGPVLFASTLSVLVHTDAALRRLHEADAAPRGVRVFGGYAQSKLASEVLVEAWVRRSQTSTTVVRYGLLVGDRRSGRGAPRDWLGMTIRGLARLGGLPFDGVDTGASFDFTPVDEAAEATVALWAMMHGPGADSAPPCLTRAHLAAPRPVPLEALLAAMRAEGVTLDAPAETARRVAACSSNPDVAAAVMALCPSAHAAAERQRAAALCLATGADFGGVATAKRLGRAPISAPDLGHLRLVVRAALDSH